MNPTHAVEIASQGDVAAAADDAATPVARTPAPTQLDETPAAATLAMMECPLHTAMRQVAEAAVTQHVLYAEGVYRQREGLAREMQVWLRLHELVREFVCPAMRTGGAPEPGDLDGALAGLPVEMQAKVGSAIRACGRRNRGEGCPLETEPAGDLI